MSLFSRVGRLGLRHRSSEFSRSSPLFSMDEMFDRLLYRDPFSSSPYGHHEVNLNTMAANEAHNHSLDEIASEHDKKDDKDVRSRKGRYSRSYRSTTRYVNDGNGVISETKCMFQDSDGVQKLLKQRRLGDVEITERRERQAGNEEFHDSREVRRLDSHPQRSLLWSGGQQQPATPDEEEVVNKSTHEKSKDSTASDHVASEDVKMKEENQETECSSNSSESANEKEDGKGSEIPEERLQARGHLDEFEQAWAAAAKKLLPSSL